MKPGQISHHQLWTAVFGLLLVAALYSFPRSLAMATSTAAPWAVLLAGATVFLMLLPTVLALAGRSGQNLIDLALDGGGRPLAIAIALVLGAFMITSAGLSLRQASELVVTALYPHTPQTFAMSTMLIVSAVGAAMAPPNAFWLASLYVWPALFSILLLLLGSVAWGQFRNVMPPTGHGILPTLLEIPFITSHFSPLHHLMIFCSFLPSPRRLHRSAMLTICATAVTWSVVILVYLMVFPLPGGLNVPFPLFEMSRLVQGGRFLERVDSIWIVTWAFGTALRTALALMACSWLLKGAFRLPDHRGAVLPLAVSTLSVALFPTNQADAIAIEFLLFRRVSFVVFFLLPLLVTLLARFRRKPAADRGVNGG